MFFKVFNGYRPPLPLGMPRGLKDLMVACWSHNPAQRPSFRFIVRCLQRLIREVSCPVPSVSSNVSSAVPACSASLHSTTRLSCEVVPKKFYCEMPEQNRRAMSRGTSLNLDDVLPEMEPAPQFPVANVALPNGGEPPQPPPSTSSGSSIQQLKDRNFSGVSDVSAATPQRVIAPSKSKKHVSTLSACTSLACLHQIYMSDC